MDSVEVMNGVAAAHYFDDYQDAALETLVCPAEELRAYLPLQLASEAGEVAGKFAKARRSGKPLNAEEVAKELGDVLWYVAVLAEYLGYDLSEIAEMNLEKLRSRQARGVLQGSGDNR